MSHKGFINVGKEKVDVPFQITNGQKSTKDIEKKLQQNPTRKKGKNQRQSKAIT